MKTTVSVSLNGLSPIVKKYLCETAGFLMMSTEEFGNKLVFSGKIDPFFIVFTDSLEQMKQPYLMDHEGDVSYVEHFDGKILRRSNRFNGEPENSFTIQAGHDFATSLSSFNDYQKSS